MICHPEWRCLRYGCRRCDRERQREAKREDVKSLGHDPSESPQEVNIEGRRDHKDPGIRFLGKATKQPNGEYHVLADVYGSLCQVAVTLTFAEHLAAAADRVSAANRVDVLPEVASVPSPGESSPGESYPPVEMNAPGSQGKVAIVDVGAITQSCNRAILDRPRDGSPPTVAVSADVLLSLAVHVLDLHRAISAPRMDTESGRPSYALVSRLAARGPVVGGEGATDAVGSVVQPVIDWARTRYPTLAKVLAIESSDGGPSFVYVTPNRAFKKSVVTDPTENSDVLPVPTRFAPVVGQDLEREAGSVVVDGENSCRLSRMTRAALDFYVFNHYHSSQLDIRMRACAIKAGLCELDGGIVIDVEIGLVLRSLASRNVLDGAIVELVQALEKCRTR